jgi:pilus assembly protein CpaF
VMSEEDNKPIVWRDGTPVESFNPFSATSEETGPEPDAYEYLEEVAPAQETVTPPLQELAVTQTQDGQGYGALDTLFSEETDLAQSTVAPEGSWVRRRSGILDDDIAVETPSSFAGDFYRSSDIADELFGTDEQDPDDWLKMAQDVTDRYTKDEELYRHVEDVLALAMVGDPAVQSALRKFTLTSDKELDREQRETYEEIVKKLMPLHNVIIPNPKDFKPVIDMAYDELLGIGPLGPLWRQDGIVDILVNGPFNISVERDGKLVRTPVKFRNVAHLQSTARRLSTLVDDRAVSRTNPIITVQLPNARVQLVWEPIATEGASVVIRKHRQQLTLAQLISSGALNSEMIAFIADAVLAKATILVSGATGSGKTTYLNILSSYIPNGERVIVIEDARELHLANDQVEYLLTKSAASADDSSVFGFDKLLRASLRMRPDRIVVGEILDSAGAQAMLEAAFTGHDGTMTTLHANNPTDALIRIAGLLRQATGMPEDLSRKQVNGTFHLIVQVSRDPSGVRLVTRISTVHEDGETRDIFVGVAKPDGRTHFERKEPLAADSPLGLRMAAAGIDTEPWESV